MKIRKNSLLLIMILTVIWLGVTGVSASTLLPTDVENPSSGCTLLGVKGEYITEIPQALKRINEIRKEACQEGGTGSQYRSSAETFRLYSDQMVL